MAVLLRDIIANGLCVVNVKRSESESESKILPQYQNSLIAHFAPAGILLGSAFPKPCHAAYAAYPAAAMRQSKGGFTMRKRYNTPHRSRVVKTRMTEEEYAEFAERLSAYNMSQAEFIRQAITGAAIRPVIHVSPVNDELLAAVGKLTAEYGKIGGNLNQIARTLNEWHSPYPQLAGEVRAAVSDLAALKFEVLQKVGDAVGNIQTYQL